MMNMENVVISIVDDDEPVRDSMRLLLESLGFRARDYASAQNLLDDPDGIDCSCLVLDLQMPGMSGLELLEMLRSRGVRVPALLVTANGDPKLESRIERAGILATLAKPVSENLLLEWIERACAASA